jgi:putative ABC transport system permease protein
MKPLRRGWKRLLGAARPEPNLQEELETHLQMQTEDNLRSGMSPEEARRAAVLKFGALESTKETLRDQRTLPRFESLFKDVAYALRILRKNPGFAAVAILTLALGIGANTAIFSILNGVLLQPLPYSNPDRIVSLNTVWRQKGRAIPRISGGDLLDVQSGNQVFDSVGFYMGGEVGLQIGSRGEFARIYKVNPDLLRVFSATPAYGRLLTDGDADRAAVVSLPFATRAFGSGPAALGQSISVDKQTYEIAGVLPATFDFPQRTDVWLTAPARLSNVNHSAYNYHVVSKLRAGQTIREADEQLGAIAARLTAAFPDTNEDKTFSVTPLRDQLVGPVGSTLWVLMAVVSLVLLISCANVANLLLARAAGRSREIALRAALGASRWRILRQLTIESLILAAAAGALGLLFAAGGTQLLLRLAPENLPRVAEVRVDRVVLLFAGAVSLLATTLFGLLPAWQTSRIDLQDSLKQGGARGLLGVRHGRLRSALVIAEVSLSVMLAVGAALLSRSFFALSAVDLGFHTEDRLVMYTHIPTHGLDETIRVAASINSLLPEIAAIPGVRSTAAAMGVPSGRYGSNGSYFLENQSTVNPPHALFGLASPNYFATMGIPLLRGREFTTRDSYDQPFVAIVSQALVRRSFPDEDPIGKRLSCGLDAPGKFMTIVGVVGDTRHDSPASDPEPELYMPLAQHPYYANEFQMVIHSALPPASLAAPIRQRMHELNPTAATSFTTLDEMIATSVATPRFRFFFTTAFAVLAVLLAMVGVYGVMSCLTAQRTSEFGLRLALGAKPGDLLTSVLKRAVLLAAAGLIIGAVASLAASRLIATMLFGLKPTDAVSYTLVLAGMLFATVAAAAIPALRAARTDPATALRQD